MRLTRMNAATRRILGLLLAAAIATSIAPAPAAGATPIDASRAFPSGVELAGLIPTAPTRLPAAATTCADGSISLVNSGFEQPAITGSGYRIFTDSLLPGWSTTASDRAVELWESGFLGVRAYAGNQFAELNANLPSALFQDVPTRGGAVVHWSLAHRGRAGVDTMRVLIGPAAGAGVEVARFSDGTSGWGRHSGTYVVPDGQTMTRFQFDAVSTAGGNKSVGNFLDDITFGTDACVEITKSGRLLGAGAPGDRILWTVAAQNVGGSPATDLVVTDQVPDRTVYAAKSIAVGSGPAAGAMTDALDSDQASIQGPVVRVVPIGETKIPGRLNPGETAMFTFQTELTAAASGTTVVNNARAAYSVASGGRLDAASNDVRVPVPKATDVSITKSFDAASYLGVNGSGSTPFTLTIRNHGPSPAPNITVVDSMPIGMSVSAGAVTLNGVAAGSACVVAARVLTCEAGALDAGDALEVKVPATFAKSGQGAVDVRNSASVAVGGVLDSDLSNNTAADVMSFDPGPDADVAVKVSVLGATVEPGGTATWQVDVMNATAGIATASGVSVVVTLPAGVDFDVEPPECVRSGLSMTCAVGSLATAATKTFVLSGVVNVDAGAGAVLTLAALVGADPGSNDLDSNDLDSGEAVVVRPARLTIKKRALGPVVPTAATVFEVVVTSTGKFEARDISISDEFTNAVAATLPDACKEEDGAISCAIDELAPGDAVTFRIELTPLDAAKRIENRAAASASNVAGSVDADAVAHPIVEDEGEKPIPREYFRWSPGDELPVVNPDGSVSLPEDPSSQSGAGRGVDSGKLPRTGGGEPWGAAASAAVLAVAGLLLRRRVRR